MKKKKIPIIKQNSSVKIFGWIILFIILPLILGGIFSIKYANREVRLAKESFNWPDTRGIITESYVEKRWSDNSNISRYVPEIEYSYKVNRKTYTNNTITFDDEFIKIDKEWSETFIRSYPKDLSVWVYYNPENPQMSILEKREISYTPIGIHIGYFLIISGIIFFIVISISFIYMRVKGK